MQQFKVGGAVRDRLLGRPVQDTDWVVVGSSAEEMRRQGYRPVGEHFPVFLHPKSGEEYALARTERKQGHGYGGFTFHASPEVTLEEDLQRRDLTINAMAEDDQGRIIDPYGGLGDLENRWLRHISPAFAEDPLRVLRVARFAARYAALGFRIAPETLDLMRELSRPEELLALSAERIWSEFSRALMETDPAIFIQVLVRCHALPVLLPELAPLLEQTEQPEAIQTNPILQRLQACARYQQPLPVRWACLTLNVPMEPLKALGQRSKTPRDCQELALLGAAHAPDIQQARSLPAPRLWQLLQKADALRRPERFELLLEVCRMDALSRSDSSADDLQIEWLQALCAKVRQVDIQALTRSGLQGAALGQAIQAARLQRIEEYLAEQA